MQTQTYDCCVVGGGMIGTAMALGIAKLGYKIALLEQTPLQAFDKTQAPDMRVSAVNMHGVSLLDELGAWQHIQQMRLRPYSSLSVWDAESEQKWPKTSFSAGEVDCQTLGYFVENRLVQLGLYKEIDTQYEEQVHCIFGKRMESIDAINGVISLADSDTKTSPESVLNKLTVNASLLLGTDGAQSQLRQAAGISCSGWQYSQYANAILVETKQKVPDETWQAFYASGPRALLPMHDNFAMLVWYDDKTQSNWIKHADFAKLKEAVVSHFPSILGDFDILNVLSFPLTRMHAKRYGQDKAIVLGDAAHTLNPLAGQGVNLGFQDVSALLQIIEQEGLKNTEKLIQQFEKKRYAQNLLMLSAVDIIYHTFSTSFLPAKLLRSFGLRAADRAGPLKRKVLKYAMGLN